MEGRLNSRLYDAMVDRARGETVAYVCMGLGYTAVRTGSGGLGVAYTYFDRKTGCSLMGNFEDFEGRPAMDLLPLIKSGDSLRRSIALALVNALNQDNVQHLPPDHDNAQLFNALDIGPSAKVAMVGYIEPLARLMENRGIELEVIDEFRAMGDRNAFYHKLTHWADAALITATTVLNNTLEEILGHLGDNVRAALLGPSTPMVAEAFTPWPGVRALAGIVPLESDPVLKSVRHGMGRKALHKYSRKVTLPCAKEEK